MRLPDTMNPATQYGVLEKPFLAGAPGERCYGVWYEPSSDALQPSTVFMVLDPLDNEADCSIRFHVRLARRLAAAGRPVLRFNYRGTGNSDGSFAELSLDALLDDVQRMATLAMARTAAPALALLGSRFGATLALLYTTRRAVVREFVLLDPILDVRRYFETTFVNKELLARRLIGEQGERVRGELSRSLRETGQVELAGLSFSKLLYEELSGFDAGALAAARCESGLALVPEARPTAVERQILAALRAVPGFEVRMLAVRRGLLGWGAESFSRESALVPVLAEGVLRFVFREELGG